MSNLSESLSVPHYRAADIRTLRERIPLLQRFGDLEIERLYDRYSESYAAGWLVVDDQSIQGFAAWLEN